MASTNGHERLEKAARALKEISTSSGVMLTRNTARPHGEEVSFPYHFLRRVGPCAFLRIAHNVTLHAAHENPRKASYDAKDAKLMVRFWNVQDPGLLASTNHEPFAEILGPENAPNSHAIMCHAIVDQDRVLLFVADHGARVLVYDVTDYLYTPPADPQPLATWTAPLSLTDEQPNTIRSIAVDHQVWTEGETTYDRIYVYAGVQRTGIQILRFAWGSSSPGDEQLVPLELVQTPGYTNWVHLRDTPGAENVLLVSDGVGLRAYGYDF